MHRTTTLFDMVNSQLSCVDETLADLHRQISETEKHQEFWLELQDDANKCPNGCENSVNHEGHKCGWCEECGNVYVIDEEYAASVVWLDPMNGNCPEHIGDTDLETMRDLRNWMWDNEAIEERRQDYLLAVITLGWNSVSKWRRSSVIIN